MEAFKILEGIDLTGTARQIPEFAWNKYAKWLGTLYAPDRIEGFVTSRKRFVDRAAAFEIAERAEQLKRKSEEPFLASEHVHI
jgi:hypothetical protein